MTSQAFKRMSNILYLIFIVLCIAFSGATIAIKASGGVPNVFGYSVCVVVSPSMTPTIAVDDVIISKLSDENTTYEVGDIISYHGEVGELNGKLITHRIVSIQGSGEEAIITTKGDANNESDPTIVRSQIVSKFVRKSIVITFVYSFFSSIGGFILIISLLGILIVYELRNFVLTLKKGADNHDGK